MSATQEALLLILQTMAEGIRVHAEVNTEDSAIRCGPVPATREQLMESAAVVRECLKEMWEQ